MNVPSSRQVSSSGVTRKLQQSSRPPLPQPLRPVERRTEPAGKEADSMIEHGDRPQAGLGSPAVIPAGVTGAAAAAVAATERSPSLNGRSTSGHVTNGIDDAIIHKTILVGDSGVGKTSLLVQFDQGKFQPGSFAATVGIGFTNKVVNVDGSKVKLQIWDTAGQERFRNITHAYYRDAHALLLLYDVTSKASFDNISAWLAEINEYAQDDVVIMLIGNKADMSAERTVSKDDGILVAKEYGVSFLETSAKTGQNVENAFMSIARDLKQQKTRGAPDGGDVCLHSSSTYSLHAADLQSPPNAKRRSTSAGCCN